MDKKHEFYELIPKPGSRFMEYCGKRALQRCAKAFRTTYQASTAKDPSDKKLPKNPDDLIDIFTDKYGMDAVADMTEINIADYAYEKGINYSTNINVGRNIPWIEDGLKSVERRALYIMWRSKLYNGKMDKVAGIAGEMINEVHPHGEQSAEDTIYRLGRSLSTMIPYITPKGNFGNMDEMVPAAPRYASAGLSPYAMDCFFSEIGAKRPIYDLKDNYKYSDKEPVYLTSRFPNILMQWNQGIGKGAASWLGAFNSKDVFKTALKMLDDPDCKVQIYPDTPIPVDIINKSDLKGCFDKAKFKVKMRAKYEIVEDRKRDDNGRVVDKHTVVFTSLPITVTGKTVRDEIIAIKEKDKTRSVKKFPEVLQLEVEVTTQTPGGIRFIVEYEKGYDPEALVEKLFTSTSLEKTISVRYVLITDNKPEMFTPREILKTWILYRYDQKRRYYHQLALKAAKDRSRLEAICTILESADSIDKAVRLIRSANTDTAAIQALMKEFKFTEFQAYCVIQIRLQSLPKMSIKDLREQRDQALADYHKYRKLLSEDDAIKESIRADLEEGLAKYGRDRMADVMNLKEKIMGGSNMVKYLFYNKDQFYAVDSLETMHKLKDRLDRDIKMATFKNTDTVVLFASDGSIKILDGYAFTLNTTGISTSQFGLKDIVFAMKLPEKDQPVALISSDGFGKRIMMSDVIKSTKSKIATFKEAITAVIPVPLDAPGYIFVEVDEHLYYAYGNDLPLLKRTAVGNRIWKFEPNSITNGWYVPETAKNILIAGEFGYVKTLDVSTLKLNKKRTNSVMFGKRIYTVVPLTDTTQALSLFDHTGKTSLTVESDKFVKITFASSKEALKFKPGTSISTPVKVFKKGRNEFYTIT